MKNFNSLVTTVSADITEQRQRPVEPQQSIDLNQWAKDQVERILMSLKAQKPAWKQYLPTNQAESEYKRQLVIAMLENGITTIHQIKIGIKRSRSDKSPWMPGVGEFIDWCTPRPEDYGLPSFEEAYAEVNLNIYSYQAVMRGQCYPGKEPHQWSHPAVYWAAIQTPDFDRKSMTDAQWRDVYQRSYQIACRKVMAGDDLSGAIPKALPHNREPVLPTERSQARKNISALRAILG